MTESTPWYEAWFNRDEYELVYRERDEAEAEQLVALIRRTTGLAPGARILDVGCGRGRHARRLARHGFDVTGIDLSERAVTRARILAREEGVAVDFHQGDMREPYCDACFDGVVNLFTAFGYFEREHDHQRAVDAMTTALQPGGWLVQDFLNAPYLREHLVPEDTHTVNGVEIRQRRWIADSRVNKEILLRRNGEVTTFTESVRLLTIDEFRTLYERAGLALEETFGDYHGRPYSETAPRLLLFARRREP